MTQYLEKGLEVDSKAKFLKGIRQLYLEIPGMPNRNEIEPAKWLLRGEPNFSKLEHSENALFKPQSGQMGSYGVFMGDCQTPIVFPQSGEVFIFDRDELPNAHWVNSASEEFEALIQQIAKEKALNLTSIGGGLEAESIVAHNYDLFNPNTGIVSYHSELPLSVARYILVTPDVSHSIDISKLPEWLQKKIKIV